MPEPSTEEPMFQPYKINTDIDAILNGNVDFKWPLEIKEDDLKKAIAVDYRPAYSNIH